MVAATLSAQSESRFSSETWWMAELRQEAAQFLVKVTTVLLLVFRVCSHGRVLRPFVRTRSQSSLTSTTPAHVPFHYSIDRVISCYVHLSHILLFGLLLKSYVLNLSYLPHKPDLMQSRIFHVLVLIFIILSQINHSCASSSDSRLRPRRQLCLRNSGIRPCAFLLDHFRPPACSSRRT